MRLILRMQSPSPSLRTYRAVQRQTFSAAAACLPLVFGLSEGSTDESA